MKLIDSKYRALQPTLDYLADEVVIAQAWKKTHAYVRSFNWYADTLALDVSALTIEENAKKWAKGIREGNSLNEMELVPAAKSEPWNFDKSKGWSPIDRDKSKPPLRPLAHISIRDQTWATAAMMCLADAVETHQGRCDLSFAEAREKHVYSYGNRLLCDWREDSKAWFRWGNSETYRKFFTDYQNFLSRPLELGRSVLTTHGLSEDVYVVNLDLTQFFNSIDNNVLIERLQNIVIKQGQHIDQAFWDSFKVISNWKWSAESKTLAGVAALPKKSLQLGLPQGLVASGFFANAYLCNFDEALGSKIFKELRKENSVVLHDYCRYVDDIRLVISAENADVTDLRKFITNFINKYLKIYAGKNLTANEDKTKITLLQDLDNEGSMSNRIKAIQSELSGPGDRESIETVTAVLEGLLVTEGNELSGLSVGSPDAEFMQLVNFDHDVRPDTLKRFAANRLESIARSKRRMSSFEGDAALREEAENELLAKKLIFAWMKDPSLGLVLRKAMEVYPDADLFQPVINSIYKRSTFSGVKNDSVTQSVMDYILADMFRAASDFNGFFQRIDYPDTLKPNQLIELISRFAQKVLSCKEQKSFVTRQALMLLAVINKPTHAKHDSPLLQMHKALHSILANDVLKYQPQQSALFEVASQITGNVDTYASMYVDYIKPIDKQARVDALSLYAKRGGPFWLALWKQLKKQSNTKPDRDFLMQFKWAEPCSKVTLKSRTQQLSKVIASDENGFQLEHGLLKLAMQLVELANRNSAAIGNSPSALLVTRGSNISWHQLWKGELKKCEYQSSKAVSDPRFDFPYWIVGDDNEFSDHEKIYWIGCILRAAVLGGADYTGTRLNKSDTVTYFGLKSSWYKRRMGMLHSPEALIGEFATVSQWTSELLMHCLQWPGFESSYIKDQSILAIADLSGLKKCVESRLSYLNSLICDTSNLPAIPTEVYRPKTDRNTFRIVTVQQLQPTERLFTRHGPTLDSREARSVHREHLAAICKLTLNTLEAKVKVSDVNTKPYCDLIVFPEVSVHPGDEDLLKRLADKTNSIIFAGFVFTEKDGKLVNFGRWLVPSYKDGSRQWIVRDQGKQHMTKYENQIGISSYRPCQHILEVHGYGDKPFKMTGAICYDATDIKLAADLRDKTDLFIVAAYNKDVTTFDNMAAALQWHMYQHVVICNIGEYGGSTIQAPYKQPYDKLISHVHGSGQISINMADIDPYAFTRKVVSFKEIKSPPAGIARGKGR